MEGLAVDEQVRVEYTAKSYEVSEDGTLVVRGADGGMHVVPPLVDRCTIIRDAMEASGFVGGDRLYAGLARAYYWPHLREDCIAACTHSVERCKEHVRYHPPPELHPICKGIWPMQVWVLDCIVNFTPPSPRGHTAILFGVDPFSKWVEGVT
ncbi:MAG: hypothetical protein AAF485_06910, partial [Chloroflexota bacterium]